MFTKPYISGHQEPTLDEVTVGDLPVHGAIPSELSGGYLRNSHTPKPGQEAVHWFGGTGMIHGVRLREGRAEWYRNRWVLTPALDGAPLIGPDGKLDLKAGNAGTNVIGHAGRILALHETNLPYALTGELDTVGAFDFGGRLRTSMTSPTWSRTAVRG